MTINILETIKYNDIYKIKVENFPFYPDGKGGQLGDRGTIKDANIIEVLKDYILIDKELKPGSYEYNIDLKNRIDIAQQHTAQHIISASFEQKYNYETKGFHMSKNYTTVDIDCSNLSDEKIKNIEDLSNNIIQKHIEVEKILIEKSEIEKYKLRKPLSSKVTGKVRLIKIGDFDINPCGGFHVNNTAEIGLIKIINKEKIKGNLTRIYYVAGKRALNDYNYKNTLLKSLSINLTTSIESLNERIKSLLEEKKELKKDLKKLSEEHAKLLSEFLIKNSKDNIIVYEENNDVAKNLIKYFKDFTYIFGKDGEYTITSNTIDCKELSKNIIQKYDVKGGGNKVRANLKGNIIIENILNILKK
ncbi:alanyl-tRNA editing protein [Tepiditoga spiralis]|uniref:Alanyl-tRNA editing protein n=1 Tax=Tepiditoga spiralis TaxID=2108365 RepID=A0A7G1G6W1_9BACT|nr:alanyl-tRNA editing protein [Tepiditoga spiralis]BBE31096.1 alanyl-tRNA editing protein [Tepiditoga spiralis]